MDLPLQALHRVVARAGGLRVCKASGAGGCACLLVRFTASGALVPSPAFLGQPLDPPAVASSSFPSPWHCLALTLRSFFSCWAGCWEVQWAVAAPAAKLGEERGTGSAREAARDTRFCEFCRWGAKLGCRRGGGRG